MVISLAIIILEWWDKHKRSSENIPEKRNGFLCDFLSFYHILTTDNTHVRFKWWSTKTIFTVQRMQWHFPSFTSFRPWTFHPLSTFLTFILFEHFPSWIHVNSDRSVTIQHCFTPVSLWNLLTAMSSNDCESFVVVVRVRPMNHKEALHVKNRSVIQLINEKTLSFNPKGETEPSVFNRSQTAVSKCVIVMVVRLANLPFLF